MNRKLMQFGVLRHAQRKMKVTHPRINLSLAQDGIKTGMRTFSYFEELI
jgi:hypothetical protein